MYGKEVLMEVADGISIITINRPEVLNAVSDDTGLELDAALDEALADDSVMAIILTGQGQKAFCAGHDIGTFNQMTDIEARESAIFNNGVCNKIQYAKKPVIAAINGFALGAGCEIAVSCDFRIASERAKFGLPEVTLGIIPGQGGTQRLPRLIGLGPAKYYILSGELMSAERAYQLGLVEKVVPPEELLDACKAIAKKIGDNGPLAVEIAKSAVNYGVNMDLTSALRFESESFASVFATEDRFEGVSAFLEKRKAEFKRK